MVEWCRRITLARSIDRLLVDRTKARELGEAGHALVSRGYTWDDRFAAFSDRVRSLVASREWAVPGALLREVFTTSWRDSDSASRRSTCR